MKETVKHFTLWWKLTKHGGWEVKAEEIESREAPQTYPVGFDGAYWQHFDCLVLSDVATLPSYERLFGMPHNFSPVSSTLGPCGLSNKSLESELDRNVEREKD